jgi:PAS domain S-box-containing protein
VSRIIDSRHWMWFGSGLVCFASIALLGAAFRPDVYGGKQTSSVLLALVLTALSVAIALHVRFLMLASRERRDTAKALEATEREFKSVFDNALDGILILDDRGTCLEANPAAQTLFGARRDELVGQPAEKFCALEQPLDLRNEHCEMQVRRGDGQAIFVEYTAKADYLPGKHVAVLRDVSRRKQAEAALRESEERFQQMAANIQEIFWMLDAENLEVIYVNRAYETITGRSCQSLREDPKSYADVIHPEDRVRVLSRLREAAQAGQFDEEFRIVRPDDVIRWVWVRGFPVRDSAGIVRRLVGISQDISPRKSAEQEIARNLDRAESAAAEAEAFRKTTLALTQNLSMDYVLDTLLQSLLQLVSCESAQILLVEADTRLFLAREMQRCGAGRHSPKSPPTFNAKDSAFLMHVLVTKNSLLIANTADEREWEAFAGFSHLRSWLCVPLIASQRVLGLLSLGDTHAQAFSQEHLRLAKSLAISAAVAIQNARLYEKAEIFRAELEQRLAGAGTEGHPGSQAR